MAQINFKICESVEQTSRKYALADAGQMSCSLIGNSAEPLKEARYEN